MWRHTLLAVGVVSILLLPAGAQGARVRFVGRVKGDPNGGISFDALGKRTRKGFVPGKIVNLAATMTYYCSPSPGVNTNSLRSDLFSQIGPVKVSVKGLFKGNHVPPAPTDPHAYVSGAFENGTAIGKIYAYEGNYAQSNPTMPPYCFTNNTTWSAKPTSKLH
jgi:hypothetical protein